MKLVAVLIGMLIAGTASAIMTMTQVDGYFIIEDSEDNTALFCIPVETRRL